MTFHGLFPEKNQESCCECGSAIIWIFILIALLGALAFAMTQGTRTGEGTVSRETASLSASEIIDYARAIKSGIQQLRINGCNDTDISFDQSFVTGYNNSSTPVTDNSCHVFDGNGAGVNWQNTGNIGGTIGFTGDEVITSVGTGAADLVFKWQGLPVAVCESINDKYDLSVATNPPATNSTTCDISTAACKFDGDYAATDTIDNGAGEFDGIMSACYNENDADTNYVFYQVLIPR